MTCAVIFLLIGLGADPARAFGECPAGAERAATNWPERPWVCALIDSPRDARDCPRGSRPVTTPSSSRPFLCALDGADPDPPPGGCPPGQRTVTVELGKMRCTSDGAPPAAARVLRSCPKGFRMEFRRDAKRGFRCVPERASPAEGAGRRDEEPAAKPAKPAVPEAKRAAAGCPPGTRRVKTENPFEPVQCALLSEPAPPALPNSWGRYEIPRELVFEYPETWRVNDAWKDEAPSIYIQPDLARDGKPVMLTLSRFRSDSPSFVDMDTAVRQEMEWHGARDGGKGVVGGLPARFLEVPKESKLAYVRTGDGYLVLGYSAPEDLYRTYAPAYARLLKSLRMVHGERDPVPDSEDAP